MDNVISTHGLVKRYGRVLAVDDLSLRVAAGEIYAFLGLNGAGKSTTIRALLGMIKPTAGEAWVLGTRIRPGERAPWASVGYLVETPNAYPELTVRENLEAMRRLRPGIERGAVSRVIEQLALTPYADRRAGTLSHGNAQRLGLAKALMHSPKLLILDEPANGLDPAGIVEIRRLLHDLTHQQGVAIFMSSHILGEVSRLAQRVGIIHRGRLVKELSIDQLERDRQRTLWVGARDLPAAAAVLNAAGFASTPAADGALAVIDERACERPDHVATLLVQAGAPPTRLEVHHEALEDYFLRLIGMTGGEPC